ncbi:hypothetical protein VTL71DRAFT_11206 [Oculimacula yallundae]|uniref:SprT-like domain-containing protein n=1 Tax=Oculimacula yallundae TaxID=86028 RepID=A0ABR4CV97_9HELO
MPFHKHGQTKPSRSRGHSDQSSHKPTGKHSSKIHSNTDTHPKIEDDFPNAKPEAYFGRDLVKTLRDNAARDITTRLDDHEISVLKLPIPVPSSVRESKKLMNTYFLIFDRAFFFNLLGKDRKDHIIIYDDHGDSGRLGYCEDSLIYINMTSHRAQPGFLGEKQVTTLLHEMLHMFFFLFACNCTKCEKRTAEQGGFGETGHGSTWANAMIYLQEALAREVRWNVFCGIEVSIDREMKASGWQPRPEQFERWKMSPLIAPLRPEKDHKHPIHKKRKKKSLCAVM